MHKGLRKPPRKGLGIFVRHTDGYVEDFRESLMRKSKIPRQRGDRCRSSKKSFNLGLILIVVFFTGAGHHLILAVDIFYRIDDNASITFLL